jgi:hypothetical protein
LFEDIMKSALFTTVLLSVVLLMVSCATEPEWARYELCFGMSTDSGKARIPEQAWEAFRNEEIAVRFPDGFTVFDGKGYWRTEALTYMEPSEILMVVAPDTPETQKKLDTIAAAYIRQFHQESVLQNKSRAAVIFHTNTKSTPSNSSAAKQPLGQEQP